MQRFTLAAALLIGFAACGDDGNPSTVDAPPGDGPPLTGERYAVEFGPITVAPGDEQTRCLNVRLSNTAAIKVHQMRNLLSAGSHHLIVYKNDDPSTVESTEPYECSPFTGALNLNGMVAPVMITQKAEDALTLPDKVAYTFSPNQMIRIEMHYINTRDQPLEVRATSEFYAVPESEIEHEANILFIGTPDIDIAAGETKDIQAYFSPMRANLDLTGTKFFAITGHTHQYGLNVTVATAPTSGGARTSVYAPTPFEWSEPETTVHKPEFTVPTGGGFDIKCSYRNTSGDRVQFGESANEEMCFFWAYYYPSKGSHVCIHTSQYVPGLEIDICCPDAGDLCNRINL